MRGKDKNEEIVKPPVSSQVSAGTKTVIGELISIEGNIQGEEVAMFLRDLLRHIPGALIVLWDNSQIHRGDPVQELLSHTSRLRLVPFPAYAPELNPDEGVWNHLKKKLANGRPETQEELMDVLGDEICRLAANPVLLRGCIQQSKLPPFLP